MKSYDELEQLFSVFTGKEEETTPPAGEKGTTPAAVEKGTTPAAVDTKTTPRAVEKSFVDKASSPIKAPRGKKGKKNILTAPTQGKKKKKDGVVKVPAPSVAHFLVGLPMVSFYQCQKCLDKSNASCKLVKKESDTTIALYLCQTCRRINALLTEAV